MKNRIKTDSAILSFIIILTGFLYQFPQLYTGNRFADDIFDFEGLIIVLLGTFLRMTARGFKKAHSKKGQSLVVEGPYKIVRNPMYLGSFLMGAGFILMLWPWWSLPIFTYLFYLRFNRQIVEEEKLLKGSFGVAYEDYMKKIPRLFPNMQVLKTVKFAEAFPRDQLWTTKEKLGLTGWPVLAVLLETFQEKVVFGVIDIEKTMLIFTVSMIAFAVVIWMMYKNEQNTK